MNGIHIQQIWIAGMVVGVLYDFEEEPFSGVNKHTVILCIAFVGIKIEWW